MSSIRTPLVSFAGGEIAPELYGRIDLDKRQTGVAVARNFLPLPHGPLQNRAGFEHAVKVKDSTRRTRLIRFAWSVEQTMVLEFGHLYIRFHSEGDTLLEAPQNITGVTQANPGVVTINAHGYTNGKWVFIKNVGGMTALNNRWWEVRNATANTFTLRDIYTGVDLDTSVLPAYTAGGTAEQAYEVATPYVEADLFDLHYAQNADVLTIAHPSYAVRELRRVAATNWTLTTPTFNPSIAAPTGTGAANVGGTGGTPINHTYVVTALTAGGLEESVASASATVSNDLTLAGHSNTVTWGAVAGASRYKVYKEKYGVYGYIGTAGGLTFSDDNIIPDVTETPPEFTDPFPSAGNYPATVAYYEQRRAFAGTNNAPQTVFATRTGTESNMTASVPIVASDAFSFTLAAREQNRIRHLVPLQDLIALTVGAEWRAYTSNGEPIAPTTVTAKVQSYNGASNVQPVTTSRSIIYVQGQGARVREIAYNWESQSYNADDISVMAPHLFERYSIDDLAYGRGPVPVVWAVRDDGVLLSNTYLPEQRVRAWARHDTLGGAFESVCCVPEGNEDILYAVVKRNIDGADHRFIERLHERRFGAAADAFFVDAGLTYSGAATDTLTGLWHLEGETVVVLGDACVIRKGPGGTDLVVANGSITLNREVTKAHVGLAISADIQTLPLVFESRVADWKGTRKNVSKVYLRVHESRGIYAGPDAAHLRPHKGRTTEPYGSPPSLISDEVEIPLDGTWSRDGDLFIRQADPLPLTICAMTLEVQVGG